MKCVQPLKFIDCRICEESKKEQTTVYRKRESEISRDDFKGDSGNW